MPTHFDLTGRVAIVTGGGRGIGRAIAERLAEAGAAVVIASRKLEVLQETARQLASLPGEVLPVACHVGRADQLESLVRETESRLGPVDILVNNSGTNVAQGAALAVSDEAFDKMIDINVKSALRLVRLTAPGMIERGRGSIINISSIAGLQPQTQGLAYSFTKAGLNMMTRSWAREFGPFGVRVNAIAPGLIQTDFSEFFWKDEAALAQFQAAQSIRRLGQPVDVGAAALLLASDESSFITGQILVIDGGLTA